MKTHRRLAGTITLGIAVALIAADWPQFRGPKRDGVSSETGLLQMWPADGPPLVWTYAEAGLGYSVNPMGGGLDDPTPLGWGYAWAPLVDGDQLICVPGGKHGLLAGLDKKTGKVLWRSKDVTGQATYSSPVIAEIGGIRQVIQ